MAIYFNFPFVLEGLLVHYNFPRNLYFSESRIYKEILLFSINSDFLCDVSQVGMPENIHTLRWIFMWERVLRSNTYGASELRQPFRVVSYFPPYI